MNHKKFILELWNDSTDRCPYVSIDDKGCYCKAVKQDDTSRMICDHFSLQLWCLTKNYENCAFFES